MNIFGRLISRNSSKIYLFKSNPISLFKIPDVIANKLNKPHSSLFTTSYFKQYQSSQKRSRLRTDESSKNLVWYTLSGLVVMGGMSYAFVPLFKMFCESQGMDANTDFRDMNIEMLISRLKSMKKVENRNINVKFVATTSADLKWDFEPSQSEISVAPGETALAFFKAKNNTNRPIIGIATYTILPYDAALYFNKIQCFCFEEQRLEPGEEIDMPVFFYIDEQYNEDPKLEYIDEICLSYTFFESKGTEILAKSYTANA